VRLSGWLAIPAKFGGLCAGEYNTCTVSLLDRPPAPDGGSSSVALVLPAGGGPGELEPHPNGYTVRADDKATIDVAKKVSVVASGRAVDEGRCRFRLEEIQAGPPR
jgi:hypothetical protein